MKKYLNRILIFLLCLLSGTPLFAQELLTLDQAIEIGLKNNFSILIAKNNARVAENEFYPGKAGMLPQLNFNASENRALINSHQVFTTGLDQKRSNAQSKAINTSITLNWTLFDGLGMFATYERQKQLMDMGEINARLAIEVAVQNIINVYYGVVLQKKLLLAIKESMTTSDERIKIAEARFKVGSDSKLTYLQAKVDYNAAKSALMKQAIVLENTKIKLNDLLSRDLITKFDVADTILISYKPTIDELKTILPQNSNLLQANKNIEISKSTIKQISARYYPVIGFNTNYNFTQANSQAGLQVSNQTYGPSFGFTASMNLFNGFGLDHDFKSAQINLMTSKINYNLINNRLNASLDSAYNMFNNQIDILTLEQENVKIAQENISGSLARYRVGSISAFDLKVAQQSYLDAETRLVNALYDAKTAETILMRLSGKLVR